MMPRLMRFFFISAGLLLILTGSAKLISSFGSANILNVKDSMFRLQFRYIFQIVGLIELMIALFCFFSKRLGLRASLVAYFVICILMYRFGLFWVGYHKPCACLGSFTDALHISPQTADTIMKFILGYLLLGSCTALLWLWRQKRKVPRSTSL